MRTNIKATGQKVGRRAAGPVGPDCFPILIDSSAVAQAKVGAASTAPLTRFFETRVAVKSQEKGE
jgi:hypothetical protein